MKALDPLPEVTAADFTRAAVAELRAAWPNAPVFIRMQVIASARASYDRAVRYGFRIVRTSPAGAETAH